MNNHTKICYACRSSIPVLASRCPHCLVELTYGGGNPRWLADEHDGSGTAALVAAVVAAVIVYALLSWAGW